MLPDPDTIVASIHSALLRPIDPKRTREVAFFGGNFLGLPRRVIRSYLDVIAPFRERGQIHRIRCSTRPDTVCPETLELAGGLGMTTVELGVQSMHDAVLEASLRGHGVRETQRAVACLREKGMAVGLQLMVGLPGDTVDKCLESAEKAVSLRPDFVRIYPTLVLEGTELAVRYRSGGYRPMSLADAVSTVANMVDVFIRNGIPVIRVGLQSSKELESKDGILAGPYHPAFGHLVETRRYRDRVVSALDALEFRASAIQIHVSPRDIPKMRGDRNETLRFLSKRYWFASISVVGDAALGKDQFLIESIERKSSRRLSGEWVRPIVSDGDDPAKGFPCSTGSSFTGSS